MWKVKGFFLAFFSQNPGGGEVFPPVSPCGKYSASSHVPVAAPRAMEAKVNNPKEMSTYKKMVKMSPPRKRKALYTPEI